MLTSMLVLPVAGAALVATMPEDSHSQRTRIKRTALITSVVTFAISMVMWGDFDSSATAYQFTAEYNQLSFLHLHIGVDGLSLYFVLLTTFTMPICILAGWQSIKHNVRTYLVCLLVLETFLIAVFVVLDLLLFYVFFEAVLIPLFLIIGIWGASANRVRASFLLFLYTLLGSLFMLLAFLAIAYHAGTTDFEVLSLTDISFEYQKVLWLAIFASLAVKTPLLPGHIWLSRAHVEAPVAASMILAGLILKLATYGFLRVLIPLLPEATSYFSPMVQAIAVVTLIYSSLTTLRQTDFKVLVAYSSVAHMSVVVIGLFSNTLQGIEGAILLGIAHGLVSPAMFMCVGGILYDKYHTRVIRYYRGLTTYMPVFSALFFLIVLGNMSTPLTLNWVGELMCLTGSIQRSPLVGLAMSSGIVLSAAYSIWLYARLCNGAWSPWLGYPQDVSRREFYVLLPFLVAMFLFGLFPNIILTDLHIAVSTLLTSAPDIQVNVAPPAIDTTLTVESNPDTGFWGRAHSPMEQMVILSVTFWLGVILEILSL